MSSSTEPYRGLFGTVNYPGMMVNNFSSKIMLATLFVHIIIERFVFAVFEEQLATRNLTASLVLRMVRTVIVVLTGVIWYFKPEEGTPASKYHVAKCISDWIVAIQGFNVALATLTYSAVIVYDVMVVNSQRVGLSPHAVVASYTLQLIPPLIFFIARDTPADVIFLSWGICVATGLVSALYADDNEQLMILFLYVYLCGVVFAETMGRHKKMCDIVATLQLTLKENERLAVEAQALELRAMIGNVAHDLKTPLTSFLSGVECLADYLRDWDAVFRSPEFTGPAPQWTTQLNVSAIQTIIAMNQVIDSMHSTNSFMTMTINRCLDYTKSTNGFKLVPKFETVSLKSALEMPIKIIKDANSDIDIQTLDVSDEISSHIITDKQWLLENLLCLLSNAVKYSHKGCVQVSVAFNDCSSAEDRSLRFEIQDTGIGLSDEAMQALFNPFKQAQRLAGGTGLGLFSLAKRMEALHGQYGVMRRPDGEQGSVFWFTIPYRPDEMSANLLPQKVPSSVGTAPSTDVVDDSLIGAVVPDARFEVLVVDDAPMIVKMTTMLLQRKGHHVQHAVNGADALEKLHVRAGSGDLGMSKSMDCEGVASRAYHVLCEPAPTPASQFDVVLMDLQMPVLDGIEAIRRLRVAEKKRDAERKGGDVSRQFLIALSANSDEETRQEALAAGADAFMCKPFTYDGFSAIMLDHKHSCILPMGE